MGKARIVRFPVNSQSHFQRLLSIGRWVEWFLHESAAVEWLCRTALCWIRLLLATDAAAPHRTAAATGAKWYGYIYLL